MQIERYGFGLLQSEPLWHIREFKAVCTSKTARLPTRWTREWAILLEEDFTALHLRTSPKFSEKDYVPEEEESASIHSSCHSHHGTCEVNRCCDSKGLIKLISSTSTSHTNPSPSSPSSISRRTHLGPRDNSFRFIWCNMVLWLEGRKVLPSHDHKGKRPDCTFCARSKEDCHHRTIWQAHWEYRSWWIFTRPERTPKARRHQDQSHQSFSQTISWTSGLEWCNLASSGYSSSKQRRS